MTRTALTCAAASAVLTFLAADASAFPGPDVQYTDCTDIAHFTTLGPINGVRAYALGSATCNIGNQDLLWTNGGTPGLAMNAYRLHDGRLEQVGQGGVKIACCAAAGNGCGLACNGQGGPVLGAGCLDVYGAGWNGSQFNLRARSGINPFTGTFSGGSGSGDATWRRLQIAQTDLTAANFPGALYFVEGHYIASDDAFAGNAMNNASYKRVTVDGSFNLIMQGAQQVGTPAIYAWQAHGLGLNTPDPSVAIVNVDVPSEGRFIAATKVKDNGNGTWRYEYAVYNFSSDRAGGSFTITKPASVKISNVGFHDVNYHSGEPFANTDWTSSVSSTEISWSSPQTFAQNPNSNALRWGTMYNFWFDANSAPEDGTATIGLFKPHTPAAVTFASKVPQGLCHADITGDGNVDVNDLLIVIGNWGATGPNQGDVNGDLVVNVNDLLMVIGTWGPCA